MRLFTSLAALAALSATLPACSQSDTAQSDTAKSDAAQSDAAQVTPRSITRVEGEIVSVGETDLTVRGADGKETTIPLPQDGRIFVSRVIPASTIKPGDFVATTNLNLSDNSGRAVELRVYPARSGTASQAASYPMAQPNTTMTNAPVAEVSDNSDGRTLTVRYPGGERTIILPSDVHVLGQTSLDKAALQPGWKVNAILRPGPDGALVTIQLLTGENGAAPPQMG